MHEVPLTYHFNYCSYGRVDELVYFAGLKEQYEIVVHHYIQVGFIIRTFIILENV
jgi:hypothetical protein